jgi:hypothetical protein
MFAIFWGEVSADSDGPVEWCKPVPEAETGALVPHYPELTLRTEPAHREAYVALGPAGGNPVQWQLASESLGNWATESGIEAEGLWHEFKDLGGPRITYLVTPPVTETSVPDCDFAVPFGIGR